MKLSIKVLAIALTAWGLMACSQTTKEDAKAAAEDIKTETQQVAAEAEAAAKESLEQSEQAVQQAQGAEQAVNDTADSAVEATAEEKVAEDQKY